MISQAFQRTFFDPGHPLLWLERIFNRFSHRHAVRLHGQPVEIVWTDRADRALQNRSHPLAVQMQMMFSCVVKKRVLFEDTVAAEAVTVTPHLSISLRAVTSDACSPEQFARDFPEGKDLTDTYAGKLAPRRLEIDFRQGEWQGQFYIA